MKALIPLLLITCYLQAQVVARVKYMSSTPLNITIEGVDMERLKDRIPSSRDVDKVLLVSENEYIFMNDEEANAKRMAERQAAMGDRGGDGRGMRMMMFGGGNDERLYVDKEKGIRVDKQVFMSREFLIEEDLPEYKWKITGEMKEINGLVCQKAQLVDTTEVVAWFCPTLPMDAGPAGYYGLPGLILELYVGRFNTLITATSVETDLEEEIMIEIPDRGKKISREEFEQIRKEKIEEMRQNYGGSPGRGNIIIRMDGN